MPHRMGMFLSAFVIAVLIAGPAAGQAKPAKPAAAPPPLFTTPLTLEQMRGKQAVIDTTAGRIVLDLLPDKAPNHVGYFIKLAQEGAYNGHDLSPPDQARHHPGRRSALEGPGEDGPVRHRRSQDGGVRAGRGQPRPRRRVGRARPRQPRQRGLAVLHLRDAAALARRAIHRVRPRRRGDRHRDADLRSAGRCGREGHGSDRDDVSHDPRRAAGRRCPVRGGLAGGIWPGTARSSKRAWATSPSSSCRRRRRTTCATS